MDRRSWPFAAWATGSSRTKPTPPENLGGRRPARGGSRGSDGDGDGASARVVDGVSAVDPATTRVSSAKRVEMDECFTPGSQAAAARRTGDRRPLTVAHGNRAELGIGRLDHWQDLPGCVRRRLLPTIDQG